MTMTRDIDFEVATPEQAARLIELCRAAGWVVDPQMDVFHYRKGVPYVYCYEGEDLESLMVPDRTYSIVIAHKTDFTYDELDEVWEKADQFATKVGGRVSGGGTAFGVTNTEA